MPAPLNGGGIDLPTAFKTGLDNALTEPLPELTGRRFGLLFNQASLADDGSYSADALSSAYGAQSLAALFSPQHGVWGEEQANMIETGHSRYRPLDVPLYSLYSQTRRPTPEMLDGLDALVIDLQDVGTRVYTFIWTMLNCLETCADHGLSVIVLDRPNPLGGQVVEGPRLNEDYRSFVGLASIPMRHGLTMGELASWFVASRKIDVELKVVRMSSWSGSHRFPDAQRHWIGPSPNMPTYRTTCVYPGGVLLEGTNLSEGRGTTIPFEVVGTPFIDELEYADELNHRQLPGVRFRATRFRPTFDKWQGQSCRGVYLDVVDEHAFASYRTTLHCMHAARKLYGDQFQWLPPPYEYETVKAPIDILSGSDAVRLAIDGHCDLTLLDKLAVSSLDWIDEVEKFKLYS